jgi:hypothetical protein
MPVPLQLTARDVCLPAAEEEIRAKAANLETYDDRLTGCRVVLKGPGRHHRQGPYRVRIDLSVPGAELVVDRQADADLAVAIRDAFDAAPCRKTECGEAGLTYDCITAGCPAYRVGGVLIAVLTRQLGRRVLWRVNVIGGKPYPSHRVCLFANATTARLVPRRGMRARSHGLRRSFLSPIQRIVARVPWRNSLRRSRSPRLLIPSQGGLPLVECWCGTSPSHAAHCRPLLKGVGSRTAATKAVAVSGPMPGMVRRRWQTGWARQTASSCSWLGEARLQSTPVPLERPEAFPTQLGQLRLLLLQCAQQRVTKLRDSLEEDNPIRTEPAAHLVDTCRAGFHQPLPRPMEGQKVLRREFVERHEAHRRPGDGLPNRFGIRHLGRVCLDGGFDTWGCYHLRAVSIFTEAPRPIMGAPIGFHPNRDGRQLGHNGHERTPGSALP